MIPQPSWRADHEAKFADMPQIRVPKAGALTDADNEFWGDIFYFRYLLNDIAEKVYCRRRHCEPWPMELSVRMAEMENIHQAIRGVISEWIWDR